VRAWVLPARAHEAGLTGQHVVVRAASARSLAGCDRLGVTRPGLTEQGHGTAFVAHVPDR